MVIGGQAVGTLGGTDSFGIVAQTVGAVTVAGTPFATTAGSGNDQFAIAMTGDVTVHEVAFGGGRRVFWRTGANRGRNLIRQNVSRGVSILAGVRDSPNINRRPTGPTARPRLRA